MKATVKKCQGRECEGVLQVEAGEIRGADQRGKTKIIRMKQAYLSKHLSFPRITKPYINPKDRGYSV